MSTIRVARYLGCTPWDLEEQWVGWKQWAIVTEAGEAWAEIEERKRQAAIAGQPITNLPYIPMVTKPDKLSTHEVYDAPTAYRPIDGGLTDGINTDGLHGSEVRVPTRMLEAPKGPNVGSF